MNLLSLKSNIWLAFVFGDGSHLLSVFKNKASLLDYIVNFITCCYFIFGLLLAVIHFMITLAHFPLTLKIGLNLSFCTYNLWHFVLNNIIM